MPDTPAVAIVEADEGVRQLLCDALGLAGFAPSAFASGGDFLAAPAAGDGWRCVIVDAHLPDLDGAALVERIHAGDARLPVVYLDGATGAAPQVEARFAKPLDMRQLVRRVGELSRRGGEPMPYAAALGARPSSTRRSSRARSSRE